jgi:hypothetical protein
VFESRKRFVPARIVSFALSLNAAKFGSKMMEKQIWIAPARRRQLQDGAAPPEIRFYASAWHPAGGWTATSRAEFDASETGRREECAEYERRWLAGEEIEDIRHDLQRRKRLYRGSEPEF